MNSLRKVTLCKFQVFISGMQAGRRFNLSYICLAFFSLINSTQPFWDRALLGQGALQPNIPPYSPAQDDCFKVSKKPTYETYKHKFPLCFFFVCFHLEKGGSYYLV